MKVVTFSSPSNSGILEDKRSTPTWHHAFLILWSMLNWDNSCPKHRCFGIMFKGISITKTFSSIMFEHHMSSFSTGQSLVSLGRIPVVVAPKYYLKIPVSTPLFFCFCLTLAVWYLTLPFHFKTTCWYHHQVLLKVPLVSQFRMTTYMTYMCLVKGISTASLRNITVGSC